MLIALGIAAYIACIIAFCLWDAYIGMPVEWDSNGNDAPPMALAAFFWPIAVPIILVIAFANALEKAKERRQEKEEIAERRRKREEAAQAKLRIQEEQEYEETMAEVEKEIHR